MEEVKKYQKPEGFGGRGKGSANWKKLKWSVVMFDKDSNTMKSGKFSTLKELNEKMGLTLSVDTCWRLRNLKRVDTAKRNGDNSFLARYGHIKIEKIDEWKEGITHNTPKEMRK